MALVMMFSYRKEKTRSHVRSGMRPEQHPSGPGTRSMKVQVAALKKHYGRTRAVDGISFDFEAGQIYGFVGPNGAGKSTTMRILATLEEPTAGDCYIDGLSVTEEPEKTHHLIGYVPDHEPSHR